MRRALGFSIGLLMAIAFDAFSNAAASSVTHSWTHTPVGTPRGVLVLIVQNAASPDDVTSVTYGGVAMAEVTGSPLLQTSAEPGAVYAYFLGSGIPTGAQTVQVTSPGNYIKRSVAISVTAAQDTSVVDAKTILSASLANPSVTLALGGVSSFCAIGFHSGQGAATGITPLTNWTSRLEHDFGNQVAGYYTYNTIGTADVTAGWTQTAEDAAALAVAIRENAAGGGITGTSSTTLALGSSADTDVLVQAAHAQTVALGRTQAGVVAIAGSHTATLTLGRTQSGGVLVQATSTQTLSLTSQALGGSPALTGTHTASLPLSSLADAGVRIAGSSVQTLSLASAAQGGSPAINAESIRLLTLAGLASGVVTGEGIPEPPSIGGGGRLRGLRASMAQYPVLVADATAMLRLTSEARGVVSRVANARGAFAIQSDARGTVDGFSDDEIVLILEALT